MGQGIILGVVRRDMGEMEAVGGYLTTHKPRTVGLQLPADYFERAGDYGWDQLFFGRIGLSLRAEGREVVPLESAELLKQKPDLLSARAAGRGIVTGTERDRELLESYGLEGVVRELAALEDKRVMYIVGRAQQTRPEVIILGSVFAEQVAPHLGGYKTEVLNKAEKAVERRRVATFQRPAPV